MWNDVVDLRDFYAGSLGTVAGRMLRRHIRALWPDVTGLGVLGLGYATPFLAPFREEAARVMAAMPVQQGVLHWPGDGSGLTLLADETELPFPDLSIDRVLLVHSLECAESVRPMMREIWRVLTGSGRLLVVAPNRRGVWARFEHTPFGHGRPYSQVQLRRVLRDTMFTPLRSDAALFVPPVRSRMVLSSAPAWEEIGQRWFPAIAGVIVAEATKEIYAGHAQPVPKRRAAYLPATPGAPRPMGHGRGCGTFVIF